jgi:hypothetical protein
MLLLRAAQPQQPAPSIVATQRAQIGLSATDARPWQNTNPPHDLCERSKQALRKK